MADNENLNSDEQNQNTENQAAENQTTDSQSSDLDSFARKRKLLNQFFAMRQKYMIKSKVWPFLNSEEIRILNTIKKIQASQYISFMQYMKLQVQLFFEKVKSIIAPLIPYMHYIIIGLIVIISVVAVLACVVPWLIDSLNDTSDAICGVNGKDFYGVRYVYRDDDQARADLWEDYANALNYTIKNFNDENITLELQMPVVNDGLDLDKLNDVSDGGIYADEYNMVMEIAKVVYGVDNFGADYDEVLVESLSKEDALAGIKYFGFDDVIIEAIATNLSEYIDARPTLYTINPDHEGDSAIDVFESLKPKFSSLLTEKYIANLSQAGEPTRTDLIYIKDYIFNDDTSTASGIKKENFIAMIYLPKHNVRITDVQYSIYGVDSLDYKVGIYFNGVEQVAKNDSNFTVFSSKQETQKEFDSYQFEARNLSLYGINFTNTERSLLTNEKSLFDILCTLKTENGGADAELVGNYLTEADENNTEFWKTADGETETDPGEQNDGETVRYFTFTYQNYLAVLMQNLANTEYFFTEFQTTVA